MPDPVDNLYRRLCEALDVLVRESPANRLERIDGAPIFDHPLFAAADGDDSLFEEYKQIIGPFHVTPREVIQHALQARPDTRMSSLEQVRVLTWVLPIAETTRRSNRREVQAPSERWAHTRHYGEQFNDEVRRFAVAWLQAEGYLAIAPMASPLFKTFNHGLEGAPTSTWSERHALYAAGQGTFSLSDGFITPRGIAMRCGSVVTNLPLPVSPRHYASHTVNCLHFRDGACGQCIERCPVGAISLEGHDKEKCRDYVYGGLKPYFAAYGVKATGCGLCQTLVPCEAGIPPGQAKNHTLCK